MSNGDDGTESITFGDSCAPIPYHAWNKDRTQIAISPNNNEVHLYSREGNEYRLTDTFAEHDMRVMGIDWAPRTNRIATCSVDRNAYVWSQGADGRWSPNMVLLRINRAATCLKWSPLENKIAVGSGARLISVCYYEEENNWWVSKHIKKPIRSTVTALDWHPNNTLLVAGCADYRVRVFSAYIKDAEEQPPANVWGSRLPLGQLLAEFGAGAGGGWVHGVSFSDDGNKVAWVAHDSSISVADATRGKAVVKVKTEHLPFLSCRWLGAAGLLVAGHGCAPLLYAYTGDDIEFRARLDNTQRKEAAGLSAMKKFQSLDRQARTETSDTWLPSKHQNAISCIRLLGRDAFSTSGMDGQVVVWRLDRLDARLNNLSLN